MRCRRYLPRLRGGVQGTDGSTLGVWRASQTRTITIAKATLYLLTSIAMVSSGKMALTSSSASSAILSCVAQFSKLQDFVFIADRMLDGIQWARQHPESSAAMVEAGQEYIRERFSPRTAADGWRQVFERLH